MLLALPVREPRVEGKKCHRRQIARTALVWTHWVTKAEPEVRIWCLWFGSPSEAGPAFCIPITTDYWGPLKRPGLPDLVNKKLGYPVRFAFQINIMPPKYPTGTLFPLPHLRKE